jgi:hypothetical protein
MHLTNGEREQCKMYFNLFLAASRRCSENTETGRIKKSAFAGMVLAFGYVLGDNGEFEKALQTWKREIEEFGVITPEELSGHKQ